MTAGHAVPQILDAMIIEFPILSAVLMMVLGLVWGSFAANLVVRWAKGESVMHGRSRCTKCGTQIRTHDMIPVLSYLWRKGQCYACKARIDPFYPMCEIICALLGLAATLAYPGWTMIIAAGFFWLLAPIILLDWRHFWLPDRLTCVLAVLGIPCGGMLLDITLVDQIIGGAAGFCTLQAIRLGYRTLRGHEGMGGGDPKLFGALGLWLGWMLLPQLILLSALLGLLLVVYDRMIARNLAQEAQNVTQSLQIPLGSMLGVSAILILFWVGAQPLGAPADTAGFLAFYSS